MIKQLKDYTWVWNTEGDLLVLENKLSKETISVDKVRVFSLMRFLIRITQKLSSHRRYNGHQKKG